MNLGEVRESLENPKVLGFLGGISDGSRRIVIQVNRYSDTEPTLHDYLEIEAVGALFYDGQFTAVIACDGDSLAPTPFAYKMATRALEKKRMRIYSAKESILLAMVHANDEGMVFLQAAYDALTADEILATNAIRCPKCMNYRDTPGHVLTECDG